MLEETELAVLTVDLPEYGLKAGDVGTVVLVHGLKGYEVEFITFDGEMVAVTSLQAAQVRPIGVVRSPTCAAFNASFETPSPEARPLHAVESRPGQAITRLK